MVWLEVAEQFGGELYLDIHSVEQRGGNGETRFAISGTLGDGQYEGPVLVEVGKTTEITFGDRYLDEGALRAFFSRIDPERVKEALIEQVSAMVFCVDSLAPTAEGQRAAVHRCRSGRRRIALPGDDPSAQLELPMAVNEGLAAWERRVA